MKIDRFSVKMQDGLRRWAEDRLMDDMVFDGTALEMWALLWFMLRNAEDKPECFPKGKSATLQHMEALIEAEVKDTYR